MKKKAYEEEGLFTMINNNLQAIIIYKLNYYN
jgi:hypothetical protein